MTVTVGLLLLVLAAIPLAIAIFRSNELFVLRVRRGKVELVRGRLPPALLADLQDVFERTTSDAEVRVVSEQQRPRAIVRGAKEPIAQHVRNVVGRFRVAQIRSGLRVAPRSSARRSGELDGSPYRKRM